MYMKGQVQMAKKKKKQSNTLLKKSNKVEVFSTRSLWVNVWQKPLQYCKVISLQLIKINGKKKYKFKKKK